MKKMLFNATHAEELRVAIVDGQKLIDLDLESAIRNEKKGNIYKGIVTQVEPSLEACFVNYGAQKQGFLPLKEIYREYFNNYDGSKPISDIRIEDVIQKKQEIIVQVDKDERGNKGAALTTFVSLAGRFLVLMPNNPKGGGISRRIEGEHRVEIRKILSDIKIDPRHSLIIRTEGVGHTVDELQWDLDFLTKLWKSIEDASTALKAPFLVYQESNLIVRSIRDYLSQDISDIIIDDKEIYERSKQFISQVAPNYLQKLKLYTDDIPLFSRYQIEEQTSSAFNREVRLASGGSISIDHTEALISIDVNSARATKGGDIEETAFQTNLEAVEEIAKQLRIRDIGGLIVIDLIDMAHTKNQRAVENRLKGSLKADRARIQINGISRFGLLEMSRQRLRSSISETNYRQCPRCNGTGTIRSVVSSSLNLLRQIEDAALKENTEAVQVVLPLDMATYLLNEKRHELHTMESRLASRIIIIPDDQLSSPQYTIKRLRSEQLDELIGIASFEQKNDVQDSQADLISNLKVQKPEKPQVQLDQITHRNYKSSKPDKKRSNQKNFGKTEKSGFIKSLIKTVLGKKSTDAQEDKKTEGQYRRYPRRQHAKKHNNRSGFHAKDQHQADRNNPNQRRQSSRSDIPRKDTRSHNSTNRPPRSSQKGHAALDKNLLPENPPENKATPPSATKSSAGRYSVPPGLSSQLKNNNQPQNKTARSALGKSPHSNARSNNTNNNHPSDTDIPNDIGNRKE